MPVPGGAGVLPAAAAKRPGAHGTGLRSGKIPPGGRTGPADAGPRPRVRKGPPGLVFCRGPERFGQEPPVRRDSAQALAAGQGAAGGAVADEAARLKELQCSPGYTSELDRLRHAPVLYLDDFLKTPRHRPGVRAGPPTAGDVNLAYEILEYRYMHPELPTLISSEWHSGEILSLDEALGGRIFGAGAGPFCSISHRKRSITAGCALCRKKGGREEKKTHKALFFIA